MRLKKADAAIQAQKNLENRKALLDKAQAKYEKAIERLKKANMALPKEEVVA